mmetsp:Transcript_59567/g.142071  ORF Transcript_59567/g.142071 Transcript_59567/m.142071 type:complete len:259 (+) Transcript_59567:462-1238(+)
MLGLHLRVELQHLVPASRPCTSSKHGPVGDTIQFRAVAGHGAQELQGHIRLPQLHAGLKHGVAGHRVWADTTRAHRSGQREDLSPQPVLLTDIDRHVEMDFREVHTRVVHKLLEDLQALFPIPLLSLLAEERPQQGTELGLVGRNAVLPHGDVEFEASLVVVRGVRQAMEHGVIAGVVHCNTVFLHLIQKSDDVFPLFPGVARGQCKVVAVHVGLQAVLTHFLQHFGGRFRRPVQRVDFEDQVIACQVQSHFTLPELF